MEMQNMKMSKKEKENSMPSEISPEEYPYGLCIRFDEEQISKLGISMPTAGSSMEIVAVAEVKSVAITDDDNNGKKRHIELQITDIAVSPKKEKPEAEKVLYGEK